MNNRIKFVSDRVTIGLVIIIWIILNLVSASLTLLYSDETYYKLLSQQLAFGYFDHPPMIALFIRLGSLIGECETGVRLLSVLAVGTALFITYRLSEVKKPVLFLTAILSIFALSISGFMALPDAPLLLFTTLFFAVYKRFLIKESTKNIILLSFTMAAMLYSKYHGILVIFFTIASNLSLLRSAKFRKAAFIGFLLFIPHLIWQYKNSFVTFSYHLFERSASHYAPSVTFEYIVGQILFYGPFTAIFMYMALLQFKTSAQFDKTLKWNIWGIVGFFLISTLKGRVEVNWTLPVIIPMLVIFLKYSDNRPVFRNWFYFSAIPVIILILLLRLQVIYPVFKINILRIDELRNQKEFVKEVVSKSYNLPIVTNTYQKAGIISYYSGAFAPSINMNGRRNQFNLWHSDDALRFRKVAYVNDYLKEGSNIQTPLYTDYKVSIIDSLPVMNDIIINPGPYNTTIGINEELKINVLLVSSKLYDNYRDAGGYRTRLHAELYKKDSLMQHEVCLIPVDELLKVYNGEYSFRFVSPGKKGFYKVKIELKTSTLGTWNTGKVIGLTVE